MLLVSRAMVGEGGERKGERENCYTFLRKTGMGRSSHSSAFFVLLTRNVFLFFFSTQVKKFLADGAKGAINDRKMRTVLIFLTWRSQKNSERKNIDH